MSKNCSSTKKSQVKRVKQKAGSKIQREKATNFDEVPKPDLIKLCFVL